MKKPKKFSFTRQVFPMYVIYGTVVVAFLLLLFFVYWLIVAPGSEEAVPTEEVIELPVTGAGDYRVFVSSMEYSGNLGGIVGADGKCDQLAATAGLGGVWHAWLSSSLADAKDRIIDRPYFLVDEQTQVVSNLSDLIDGTLQHSINKDESGNVISGNVWTGTNTDGTKANYHCTSWTNGGDIITGEVGDATVVDSNWTSAMVSTCDQQYRLFCFEQYRDSDGDGYYEDLDCNDSDPNVHPNATEACNNADDDCDGDTDENLFQACGTDAGECTKGQQQCVAGNWGTCEGEITPSNETCDNKDNDCDGTVDEDLTKSCGKNTGICTKGTQTCSRGSWSNCSGVQPRTEVCDGLDNDCDAKTDEGCSCTSGNSQSCGNDVGYCQSGTQLCDGGAWGACSGAIDPLVEVCDGIDNDCDGQVDEGLSRSCGTDTGMCKQGTQSCRNGQWGECSGGVEPTSESCDNKDNDCDGTKDEGCSCTTGEERECGSDIGECDKGSQVCEDGFWSDCLNATVGSEEVCDQNDNDCDGETDEGYVCEEEEVAVITNNTNVPGSILPTSSTNLREVILIAGGTILVLGGVGGAFYFYRRSRQNKAFKQLRESTSARITDGIKRSPLS